MKSLPESLYPWFFERRFIVVKTLPPLEQGGKDRKLPINYLTGAAHDAHDPAVQTDFVTASIAAELWGEKLGFVFTASDPYFFVDIDNCVVNGAWSPLAYEVMNLFPGAAIEVSNSGTGLHIFGRGASPSHRCKNVPLDLEFYTEDRFVLLTGTNIVGNVDTDHTPALAAFVEKFMKPDAALQGAEWTDGPCAEWNGPEDDDALLALALGRVSPAAAFGSRASFRDLFEGNAEILGRTYPHGTKAFDGSSADSALAYHLAYWTGRDCERIKRLMMRSALVRDKWSRDDYMEATILKAAAGTKDVYKQSPVAAAFAEHTSGTANTGGSAPIVEIQEFVFADLFEKHFQGCVYVSSLHRMFSPEHGLLKPEQVRALYGRKLFIMDAANEKTTSDAWEAFANTRCGWTATLAEKTAYRPDLPYGSVFTWEDGALYVNTYKPHDAKRVQGDPSIFLNHMRLLLPDERDRTILLSYMAALVQNPGKKFTWCPLIQGAPGNGKTTLSRCVEYAVGKQHSHWPRADQISEKFNSWLFDKVFIGVEDIFVSQNRQETMEVLKPMITGESLSKRAMNTDSFTAPICCNFMMNANRKDAIYKDKDDRRFAMFFTAQQSKEDLERDGMTPDYFERLYGWLKYEDGYAIVAEYLFTFDIPNEFNPAKSCQRAPKTTSTEEAVNVSTGNDEFAIQEAIESEEIGFKGNFISSTFFSRFIKDKGLRISLRRYREILERLGYVPHPALDDGRSPRMLAPDGIRSRLYVKRDSVESYLQDAEIIMQTYTTAQISN